MSEALIVPDRDMAPDDKKGGEKPGQQKYFGDFVSAFVSINA